MKVLHTLPRHARSLAELSRRIDQPDMKDYRYVIVCIDGPESVNRQASWSSSFDDVDTHKIFQALAEQTRK